MSLYESADLDVLKDGAVPMKLTKRQMFLAGLLRGEAYSNLEAQERCNFLTYASQCSGDLRNDENWPTSSAPIRPGSNARRHFMDFARLADVCGSDEGSVRQLASSMADRVQGLNHVDDFVKEARRVLIPRTPRQVDLFAEIARGNWADTNGVVTP